MRSHILLKACEERNIALAPKGPAGTGEDRTVTLRLQTNLENTILNEERREKVCEK